MSEQEFTAPTFLPAEDEPPSADDALSAVEEELSDLPALDDVDLQVEAPDELPPIGRGWAFDFQEPGFRRGVSGRGVLATRGVETLRGWIDKALRTARGAHAVHPDDYGMDDPWRLIGTPLSRAPIAEYEDDVRRALTFHPRIADVTDFRVALDPDVPAVELQFTVVLDDDTAVSFDPFRLP